MIIPSIDLMGGKAVQLVQGKKKVYEDERDPVKLARYFNRFGPVAVIDLDAAFGRGDNIEIVKKICRVAEVRAGGGIREEERGRKLLRAGASKIIIGTAATEEFLSKFPRERVMLALDEKKGEVVDNAWRSGTGEGVIERGLRLRKYCSGYLITFVETEGKLEGINLDKANEYREKLGLPITVAGGAKDTEEAAEVAAAGFDVQVGMGLYTGKINLSEGFVKSVKYNNDGLVPTVTVDESGRVLMLAYNSPESLKKALNEGRGIYFSRSRKEIWEKGLTSGNTQELISARLDCDNDTVLFTVKQKGHACHLGKYSCFNNNKFTLNDLYGILADRVISSPEGSYTKRLLDNPELLNEKIIEESNEVVNFKDRENLVWEIADLVYMTGVLAAREGIEWNEILAELGGRRK